MWEQSMQVEALRLLAAWWDSSRPTRPTRASWRWGRAGGTATTTVTDVLALPSGYRPAHLDERVADVS